MKGQASPTTPEASGPATGFGRLLARLPRVLLAALRDAVTRPGVLLLFLLLNLGLALVVAAPVRSLLSAELDDNLYGDVMEDGVSWRWFDTVEREHPEAVGDYSPWTALLSEDGVRLSDLAAVSGPAAALLLAGLLLFLLQAPLHVGYLAAGRRGPRAVVSAGLSTAGGAAALAVVAMLLYAGVYALLFVLPAAPLERFARFMNSEPLQLAHTWLRLGLTAVALLAVKVVFDLAKLGLARQGSRAKDGLGGVTGLPAALLLAGREAWRRGWAYLAVDVLLTALAVALGALWWWLSGPLVPATWLGLAILFVLHQLFLALRIALRLAQLDAVRGIHGWALAEAVRVPPPVAPPARPASAEGGPEDQQAEKDAVDDEGRHVLPLEPGEERPDDQVRRDGGDD